MDRLSSCYFCGTALDEPLQDYPLVAGETGEYEAVVTLCPGCHHKLETVLDVVVGERADLPALEDTTRAALEGESPAALTEPDDGEAAPDPIALGDGEQDTTESSSEASEADSAGGDDEGLADDTNRTEGASVDPATAAGNEAEPGEEPLAVDNTDPATETDEPGEETDSPAAGERGTTREDIEDATTAGDTADEGGGTDPDREVTATVSALEYNKVMRLLQNREFPVNRAEIETVATSAYELSRSECAAVIDLAVDRGLVAERDGQLVRPDG